MTGAVLTLTDIAKGLAAMLRRLDAENIGDAGAQSVTNHAVGHESGSAMNTDSGRR